MPIRETKTLSFTPTQALFVSSCVDSGRYQSASEVVRAGLRLLQDQEDRRVAELQRLRALIQVGADQLDRGEVVDGEDFFRQLEAEDQRALADGPPNDE